MKAIDLIKTHEPCGEAVQWLSSKTPQEAWNACHRGDWMLWFYENMYPDDFKKITLVKGYCANTVRHLMKDERSLKAVYTAIAFGEGRVSREELGAVAYAAYAYAAAVDANAAAYAAAVAAANAAYAVAAAAANANAVADAAADAAAAAAANAAANANAVADAAAAARIQNQKQTADICRKYLHPEFTL